MLKERNNENCNVIYMLQHQYLSNRFKQEDIYVQNLSQITVAI